MLPSPSRVICEFASELNGHFQGSPMRPARLLGLVVHLGPPRAQILAHLRGRAEGLKECARLTGKFWGPAIQGGRSLPTFAGTSAQNRCGGQRRAITTSAAGKKDRARLGGPAIQGACSGGVTRAARRQGPHMGPHRSQTTGPPLPWACPACGAEEYRGVGEKERGNAPRSRPPWRKACKPPEASSAHWRPVCEGTEARLRLDMHPT